MKNLLYAVAVFGLAIILGIAASSMLDGAEKDVDLAKVMELADKAAPKTQETAAAARADTPAADELRGAPLTAPAEEPASTDDPSVPMGSPLGDDFDMQPSRTISDEALKLIEQAEGPLTDDPEKLLQFEKTEDGDFTKLTFAALGSFQYEVPDPEVVRNSPDPKEALGDQVPEPILDLNQDPIVIVGFMVPIDVDKEGRVKSFALTQNQMFCCYGIPPAMNEWMMVEMEDGEYADFTMDLPVAAYGQFDVGEEVEDGYVLSLYRMNATEVIDVQELLRRTGETEEG